MGMLLHCYWIAIEWLLACIEMCWNAIGMQLDCFWNAMGLLLDCYGIAVGMLFD